MANIYINISKEDIKTSVLGENILVQCDNNINLIFTRDSLQELISDFTGLNDTQLYTKNDVSNFMISV